MQGMAPKAYIGVYKIAGAFGFSTDEVEIQALEDAVKDGMDVISMSYGALAVSDWASDPLATAFELAATSARPAGSLASSIPIPVIMVAAGNDGSDSYTYGYNNTYPSFNTISSPSNAPDVISVGATTNSHIMQPSLSATAASAPANVKNIVALPGDSYFYPSVYGANSAPLLDVSKIGDPTACTALPLGSPLANSFALIVYSSCSFDTAALNAQNAGAVGFVYIMPAGTAVAPFDYTSAPSGINEYGPSVSISSADGVNLKNYIDQGYTQSNIWPQITIDLGGQELEASALSQFLVTLGYNPVTQNMVAAYSSFGPTPDGQLKPDIVATGGWDPSDALYGGFYVPTQSFDAYDSAMYSANGFMAVDGTSFATPLVAGAAALAIQKNPGLQRGKQVRSLIVNASAQTVTTDDFDNLVDAQWIGAGLLDAGAATSATVSAEPATISFGILQSSSFSIQKTVTVTNIGSGSVTLAAPKVSCCTVNGTAGSLGASVTAALSSMTLAAGATSTLTVTLSGSLPAAGEYSGSVALQGTNLHIPFMLLVGAGTNCNSTAASCNIEPYYAPASTILEGPPMTDTGALPYLQVTDQYGVPVTNAQVTFTVTPTGGLTMNSASGHPACQSAPSANTVTCLTDQFGWAWMDVTLGSSPGQPEVTYQAAGYSDYFFANIQAAPTISVTNAGVPGVVDAAAGLTTIAPGSYVSIYGGGFTGGFTGASDEFNLLCPNGLYCVYPLSFDYVSVSFDVPNATYAGYPYYVAAGQYPQINLVVPWELEGQTSAQVKVLYDGDLYSNVVTVPLANYAPAFFVSCNGVCALDTSYHVISSSNPAKRGQYVFLYANGLGPVSNPPGDGVPAPLTGPLSSTTTTPVVTIGGAVVPALDVQFSGLAPGYPALYQVNVVVPQSSQTGNGVPISLQIGGATTPASTAYGSATISVQ